MTLLLPAYNKLIGGAAKELVLDFDGIFGFATTASVDVTGYDHIILGRDGTSTSTSPPTFDGNAMTALAVDSTISGDVLNLWGYDCSSFTGSQTVGLISNSRHVRWLCPINIVADDSANFSNFGSTAQSIFVDVSEGGAVVAHAKTNQSRPSATFSSGVTLDGDADDFYFAGHDELLSAEVGRDVRFVTNNPSPLGLNFQALSLIAA